MQAAQTILSQLQTLGVQCEALDGRIRFRPADRVPPELLAVMRQHRGGLLRLLTGGTGGGRSAGIIPRAEEANQLPSAWDQAAAERLLADLRAEVKRAVALDFGGRPPPLFRAVAANLLAQAEGYVANRDVEAARGWDALELLRGVMPVLRGVVANVRALPAPSE
jgi:hypothetical protein